MQRAPETVEDFIMVGLDSRWAFSRSPVGEITQASNLGAFSVLVQHDCPFEITDIALIEAHAGGAQLWGLSQGIVTWITLILGG